MISLGDLAVVLLAVGIVMSFVFLARRYIQRAQASETSEDPALTRAAGSGQRR